MSEGKHGKPLTNVRDYEAYSKISVSEYQSILRCTQQWKYKYVDGLSPVAQKSYLSKGSYLHSLMEGYWIQRYLGGVFNLAEASEYARKILLEERDAVVGESDKQEIDTLVMKWIKDNPWLKAEVADAEGTPIVEQEFYVDIGWEGLDGKPVLFHGFIDLALVERNNLVIVEHKTASRAWSQLQLQQNLQGPLYALALQKLTDIFASEVRFNFFYPTKLGQASIFPTKEWVDSLHAQVQQAIYLRDSGSFTRSVHWSCNGCPFASICALELQGRDPGFVIANEYKTREDEEGDDSEA